MRKKSYASESGGGGEGGRGGRGWGRGSGRERGRGGEGEGEGEGLLTHEVVGGIKVDVVCDESVEYRLKESREGGEGIQDVSPSEPVQGSIVESEQGELMQSLRMTNTTILQKLKFEGK